MSYNVRQLRENVNYHMTHAHDTVLRNILYL